MNSVIQIFVSSLIFIRVVSPVAKLESLSISLTRLFRSLVFLFSKDQRLIHDEEWVIGFFQRGAFLYGQSAFSVLKLNSSSITVANSQIRINDETFEMFHQIALQITDTRCFPYRLIKPSRPAMQWKKHSCGRISLRKLPSLEPPERGE